MRTAAVHDFHAFYRQEMVYRRQMKYPPAGTFTALIAAGADRDKTEQAIRRIAARAAEEIHIPVRFLGPTEMSIYKVKDMYRQVLYFKTLNTEDMIRVKRLLEEISGEEIGNERLYISFER